MGSFLTDKGLAELIAAVVADNVVRQLGWGTGSGQGVANNDLATPANESRVAGALSQVDTNTVGDTLQIVGKIIAGGARAITEVGLFDAAGAGNPPAGGDMAAYSDFAVINLATGDSIEFTMKITLDQAA